MKKALMFCGVSALVVCPLANASDIIGYDMRGDNYMFTTTTTAFVADYVEIATASTWDCFAMDLTPDATTLWGIQYLPTNGAYGTIDPATGVFTVVGTLSITADNFAGLSVDPTTGDWYVLGLTATAGNLYVGDITTGVFSLVGDTGFPFMIDLAIDSQGNCYGHDISTDSLSSINLNSGAATLIGATGQSANYAQGMDFDYSTNILYATIYTGAGVGAFCSLNLTTGAATVLDITTPLDMEAELAVNVAHGSGEPTMYMDGPHDPFQPLTDPTALPWHELWPQFCNVWDCIGWVDNGDGFLSECDVMEFADGTTWHVDWIGPTAIVELIEGGPVEDWIYIDYQEPWPGNPIGPWHEIYPSFCTMWNCIDWMDNGNGILDLCDWMIFDTPTGQIFLHVVEVATDIIITEYVGPTCPEDINGDGVVDVLDLLALLAAWGNPGGPEDLNGDGIVDVLDLLQLLAAWGPCP